MAARNKTLTLVDLTAFDRVNHHTPKPIVEPFFAITLRDADGNLYVNYTRQDTAFAIYCRCQANIGDTFEVGFQLGEFRDDEYGPHYKISRVQVGGYGMEGLRAAKRKADKRAARLAKLGLR